MLLRLRRPDYIKFWHVRWQAMGIGAFIERRGDGLTFLYVCLLPCLPIRFDWYPDWMISLYGLPKRTWSEPATSTPPKATYAGKDEQQLRDMVRDLSGRIERGEATKEDRVRFRDLKRFLAGVDLLRHGPSLD